MQPPLAPPTEPLRVRALNAYGLLDTPAEPGFDDLVRIAAAIVDVPIALVSLVDTDRQWFKARFGLSATQTARDVSFCGHAILQPDDVFVVEDATADPRFADNPLVAGEPHIRFYAGAALLAPDGHALGTICVIDRKPKRLDVGQRAALLALARQTVVQIEWRRQLLLTARESRTDPSTGVGHERALQSGLARHWARHADAGTTLAVLALRIDGFRAFEARHGPMGANALLKDTAHLVQDILPMADPVTRWGPDGFAAVMPACDLPSARRRAQALVEAASRLREGSLSVSVSVGCAVMAAQQGRDPNLLTHHAGLAQHRASLAGGARHEVVAFAGTRPSTSLDTDGGTRP